MSCVLGTSATGRRRHTFNIFNKKIKSPILIWVGHSVRQLFFDFALILCTRGFFGADSENRVRVSKFEHSRVESL